MTTFSTVEVCRITGITPRQAQCFHEAGLVRPRMAYGGRVAGKWRVWSSMNLFDVLMIVKLRSKGISIKQIRKLKRGAWQAMKANPPLLRCSVLWYFTDGIRTRVAFSHLEVLDTMHGWRGRVAAFNVVPLVEQVRANGGSL